MEADPRRDPERETLKQLLRDVTRWKESRSGGRPAPRRAAGRAVPFTLKEEAVTARRG